MPCSQPERSSLTLVRHSGKSWSSTIPPRSSSIVRSTKMTSSTTTSPVCCLKSHQGSVCLLTNLRPPDIELIEERRELNPDMDAIYLLSPQPHIVECLLADIDRGRYRRRFIIWTALPPDPLQRRLEPVRRHIAGKQKNNLLPGLLIMVGHSPNHLFAAPPDLLFVDFFPRESHLITFRDPSSFLVLYNPSCNDLVARHLRELAQKVREPIRLLAP
jgi:hypothetical protein